MGVEFDVLTRGIEQLFLSPCMSPPSLVSLAFSSWSQVGSPSIVLHPVRHVRGRIPGTASCCRPRHFGCPEFRPARCLTLLTVLLFPQLVARPAPACA
eukprot:187020-Pyramimonas_sp.AAC.1